MFSDIFIRRPRFALVISLFIMLGGILCMFRLPIAEYPQVSPPSVMVMASYPGASAEVIADTVASPLESEVNGIEDMIYYSSQSDNLGNYTLTLMFKSGSELDSKWKEIQESLKNFSGNELHLLSLAALLQKTDAGIRILKSDAPPTSNGSYDVYYTKIEENQVRPYICD